MKYIICVLTLFTLTFKAYASPTYKIDEALSTVSFATIKKQYVVESAVINNIKGFIDETGTLKAQVPLLAINTGIQIRDQRLNELFFNSQAFPNVEIVAKVPEQVLGADKFVSQVNVPSSITLMGVTKEIELKVNVVKAGNTIVVSTSQPIIVNAADFSIPSENLQQLSATVGDIALASSVPVSVSIIFNK